MDDAMTHHELPATEPALESTQSAASAAAPMNKRRVLLLAIPIVGENLLQTAVGAVDTLIVSRIGDDAIAGVGIGAELVFFLLAILASVSIGATVLVAQATGAGDRLRANLYARQAISWGIAISIPLSILGFLFAEDLIGLFNAEPEVDRLATEYFEVIAITVVVLLLSYLCGAVLRGSGDSRTPLKAAVLANVANVFFSYGLAFGEFGMPELGVAGSAARSPPPISSGRSGSAEPTFRFTRVAAGSRRSISAAGSSSSAFRPRSNNSSSKADSSRW
jgi:Na+-driven multidrug efflux pump